MTPQQTPQQTTDQSTEETGMTEDAGVAVRYDLGDDGLATVTFDQPGSSTNLMNADYEQAMGVVVDRLEADVERIRGVLLTSAKQSFFAGGDLELLLRIDETNVAEFAPVFAEVKSQLRRLERLGRPVVAVLAGAAHGGGLEIALSAHRRIAVDDSAVRFSFPEVKFGLIPGSGGVSRLVRLLGLQTALPLLLQGTELRPHEAHGAGLVDEVVPSVEAAYVAAREWIDSAPEPVQPWDRKGAGTGVPDVRFGDPQAYQAMAAAPAMLHKQTRGSMVGPEKLLAAAVEGAFVEIDTALEIESRYFLELLVGQVPKNLIGTLWHQLGEVNAGAARPDGVPARSTGKVAVLGAGMMGVGIAQVSAYAGIDVVLKDVSEEAATTGRDRVAGLLDERVAKGRLSPERRERILERVRPTANELDLEGCDLVIEAVFEDRELKNRVLADAEAAVLPDAVLASNTSTLPISGLARAVGSPERFVGLHFFSPVHKMPLVEIIRGERTSEETLARAFDYVRQINKTPIVVNDSRGFFTSRVFGTYVREGVRMLTEGVPPALIENLARQVGMPVGPLAVADEVSLGLLSRVRAQEVVDARAAGEEPPADPAYDVLDAMVELGRGGRVGGAGFYDYPNAESGKRLWPELAERFGEGDGGVPEQDIRDRLLYIQAVETRRCLREGVLTSERDANIGSILGIGFPAWTGGAARFVTATGADRFAARAEELAKRYGDRFTPPA